MKKIILLFFILGYLTACQSAKDALTLKKKESGDEFLVEKKNPLVLPPDYGELPLPQDIAIKKIKEGENEVKVLLSNDKIETDNIIKNSKPSSLEKSIIDKVR
tara:strand:+ start:102 stop:410 length:309 start_codon:yes stop_codon:yes gene_type:complete